MKPHHFATQFYPLERRLAFKKEKADRRREWLERQHADNPRCHYCKNKTILMPRGYDSTGEAKMGSLHATLDHAKPRTSGGPDHVSNWRLACYTCNQLKGDRRAEDYLAELIAAGVRESLPA